MQQHAHDQPERSVKPIGINPIMAITDAGNTHQSHSQNRFNVPLHFWNTSHHLPPYPRYSHLNFHFRASCGSSFDPAPFPATRERLVFDHAMLDLITIFSAAGLQQELKSAHGDKSCWGWKRQHDGSKWNPRITLTGGKD